MSSPEEQLREAFQAHEHLAPDAAAVYARVTELSRTYKWRRRGVTAAGGVVVGAGLITGLVNLPAVLPDGRPAEPAAPAVQPSPAVDDGGRALDAYTGHGYGSADAEKLAELWHVPDLRRVKVEAGRRLLAGQKLPFPAAGASAAQRAARIHAFADAGYDRDDAAQLAKLWGKSDLADVKAEAGRRLLDGQRLPIEPDPALATADADIKRVTKFFDEGYDYADAEKLAEVWHQPDPYSAKVEAGRRLLAGESLPIKP